MSKKLKSKVAAFLLVLQFFFSFVLPLQPLVNLVQAQENQTVTFSKQESSILVANSKASKFSYFFRDGNTTHGSKELVAANNNFELDLKSQSGEDETLFNVKRLVLKTDLNSYFLEIAENEATVLKEYQADSLELNAEEENFLLNSWQVDSATRMSTTSSDVVLNQEYRFPLNEDVRVTFSKLPSKSSPLSIQEVQLSAAQQKALGTTVSVAYDVTTTMKDGEFAFDLRLPSVSSENKNVSVKFAETVAELTTAKTAENELVVSDGDVMVKNLDHMTIFVVIDDGDANYSDNSWNNYTSSGYNGDVHWANPSQTDKVATWTFNGVAGKYAILPSWIIWTDHATNAHYTSSMGFDLSDVDQRVVANTSVTGTANGLWSGWYVNSGRYDLNSGDTVTLSVEVGASATNGNLTADAIAFVGMNDIYVDDDWASGVVGQDLGSGKIFGVNAFATVQEGISAVSDGGVINVANGTYVEVGQIVVNKNLSIVGEDKVNTIIKPSSDVGAANDSAVDSDAWIIASGTSTIFNISNVTLDGTGKNVREAIRHYGNGLIDNLIIKGIQNGTYYGTGIDVRSTGIIDVTNTNFSQIGRVGVVFKDAATSTLSGNTYTGKGNGDWLDYAFDIQYGANVTIDNNTISNNKGVASSDLSDSAGISVWDDAGTTTITNNTFTGNHIGVAIAIGGWGGPTDPNATIGNGNIFDGGDIGVDLENVGSAGDPTITFGSSIFKGQPTAINIADGISVGRTIDISSVIFKDSSNDVITNSSAIESLVYHLIDASNRGLLRWDYQAPTVPAISVPTNNIFITSALLTKIDWSDSLDSSSVQYQYQAFSNAAYTASVYTSSWLNSSEIPTPGTPNGTYYVRVKAKDSVGNESAWSNDASNPYKITVDNIAPTVSINSLLINDKTPALNGTWTENTQLNKIEVIVSGQTKEATVNPDHTWVLADNQLAALADGVHDVQVKATDEAGNVGNDSTTNELQIDSVAPTAAYTHYLDGVIFGGTKAYVKNISQLKFSGTYSDVVPSSGLLKDSFVIFQAQDNGSFNFSQNGKLAYCGWRNPVNTPTIVGGVLNDIAFADCKSDLGEGEYYLTHQVYDNAIRWDIPSITQFRDVLGLHFVVDQTKPTVTASVNPSSPDGTNGWYKTQPVITLSATDAALDKVEYHWNSDSWSTYSSPLTLANEGTHTLYYRAIDLAGNVSDEGSLTLKLDQTSPTAPTMEGFKNPTLACGAITNIKTVTVDWSNATDNLSLAGYDYEINYPTNLSGGRGTWNTFFTASQYRGSLNEGVHHVKVRAKDSAGNVSAWASACDITYDSIAPTLDSQTLFEGWYNSDQTSTFNFTDSVSTVLSNNPISCTISTEGIAQACSVTPNVCDEAGNCYTSELISNGADIDKTKPTSEITSPTNGGNGSTFYTNDWDGLISGTANDTLSGVDRVTLSIQRVDGQFWNGEGWSTGTEEDIRVTADGITSWTYSLPDPTEDTYFIISHAIDNANNIENSYKLTIVFDKTIPEIKLSIDPVNPDGKNGWYTTRPTITLTMTDDKLTDYMQYQWESQTGAWTTYAGPIQPGSEGRHILYYRAIDKAGNSSAIGIKNLAWDKTELTDGPLKVDATPDRSGGPDATVTWEAATDNVGIDHYKVTFDLLNGDADFSEDVASHVRELKTNRLKESGTWKITVIAYDGAGHEKSASDEIVVDKTAPAAPTLNLVGTGAGSVNLAWNKVDEADEYIILYGVNDGEYTYAARVGNVLSYTVQGLTAGNYYFVVRAEDGSGNQSANSNQVSTLSLLAAPGGGNEVAQGFAETPEVLGVNTAEQSVTETPAASNGEVQGANTSCNDLVNSLWWILLLAQFIGLFITEYRLGKKQKWLKLGLYALLAVAPFTLTHYFVSQACFSNAFTSWMVRYYFVPVLTTAMLAKVASYLLIEDES